MTFYSWMIKNHRNENTPLGDLSDDMYSDRKQFIRSTGYRRNRAFLVLRGACQECLEAFEMAWSEYARYKSRQSHA